MGIYLFFTIIGIVIYFQAAFYFLFLMSKNRVNRLFIVLSVLLGTYTLLLYLLQTQSNVNIAKQMDVLATIVLLSTPIIFHLLIYNLHQKQVAAFKTPVYVLFVPLASIISYNYVIDPSLFRVLVFQDGLFYHLNNQESGWMAFYSLYIMLCAAYGLLQVGMWVGSATSKRSRIQALIVISATIFFVLVVVILDLFIPGTHPGLFPPLMHLAGIPLIAGLFLALTGIEVAPFGQMVSGVFVKKHYPSLVIYFDRYANIIGANDRCPELTGYGSLELQDIDPATLFNDKKYYEELLQCAAANRPLTFDVVELRTKQGEVVNMKAQFVRAGDRLNEYMGFAFIVDNQREMILLEKKTNTLGKKITESQAIQQELTDNIDRFAEEIAWVKKQTDPVAFVHRISAEKLEQVTLERDTLLQELHHRVKNMLQIVDSLLSFSLLDAPKKVTDTPLFDRVKLLVREISDICETAYMTPALTDISVDAFLRHTASSHKMLKPQQISIQCHSTPKGLQMPVRMAVACGVIVHELVKNSLMHAFPNDISSTDEIRPDNLIWVGMSFADGQYCLTVSDNGIGIQGEEPISNIYKTGLSFVDCLVNNQLEGSMMISQTYGTSVKICFPVFYSSQD